MRVTTPPRKLKARVYLLVILLTVFLATLMICSVFFVSLLFTGVKILSPIANGIQSNNESQVTRVESFCKSSTFSCVKVESVDSGTIQVTLEKNATILLSTKKDLSSQLASLQRIVTQLTIKGQQFKKLDFRFASVIATF